MIGSTQLKPGSADETIRLGGLLAKCIPFSRIRRVVTYVLRWNNNARTSVKLERRTGELHVAEIQEALSCLIKSVQITFYSKERAALRKTNPLDPASELVNVRPYLDYCDLIRVGGRTCTSRNTPSYQHVSTRKNH